MSEICADLPEAERELRGNHAGFRVRRRIFAWYLDDHHGDGIVAITCKAPPGRNAELVALDSRRFFIPSYSGPRGWVALRLDLGSIDWEEVAGLLLETYLMTAPKHLADRLTAG